MPSDLDIAQQLKSVMAKIAAKTASSTVATTTIESGTATSNSADSTDGKTVDVILDAATVVTGEDDSQAVTLPTNVSVKTGDTVQVTCTAQGAKITSQIVTGVTGRGTEQADATAAAQTAADDAKSAAADNASEIASIKTDYVTNSTFDQSNTEIKASVSDSLTQANTYTDGQISTEVTNRNAAITESANEIKSEVSETYATQDNLAAANSAITQNANAISSEVTARETTDSNVSTLSTKVTQNADSITTEIGDRESAVSAVDAKAVAAQSTADAASQPNLFPPSLTSNDGKAILVIRGTASVSGDTITLTAKDADMYFGEISTSSGAAYASDHGWLIPVDASTLYSVIIDNSLMIKNYITEYDANKNQVMASLHSSSSFTFTTQATTAYITLRIGYGPATVGTSYSFRVGLYKGTYTGAFKPYVTPASTVQAAQSTAATLSTLIRESSSGIDVGKSSDGRTYSTSVARVGSDGAFHILTSALVEVAKYAGALIELGKNSASSVIKFCAGNGQIGFNTGSNQLYLSGTNGAYLARQTDIDNGNNSGVGLVDDNGNSKAVIIAHEFQIAGIVLTQAQMETALVPKVLYNGGAALNYNTAPGSGTNGTVRLSETAANFSKLTIFFKTSQYDALSSISVSHPDGRKVSMFCCTTASGAMVVTGSVASISGTSIAPVSGGHGSATLWGGQSPTVNTSENPISIVRVEGIR
jgi:virulence-associated protein VagC